MKSRVPKLFEMVILGRDRPDRGLVRGQKGSIVEVHGNGTAFEVEFVDSRGRTLGVETLPASEVQLERQRDLIAG